MANMVARAVARENFVTIDQVHCRACIFVSLTLFSIEFRIYVKILKIQNF